LAFQELHALRLGLSIFEDLLCRALPMALLLPLELLLCHLLPMWQLLTDPVATYSQLSYSCFDPSPQYWLKTQ
jgi:hypothetical protein